MSIQPVPFHAKWNQINAHLKTPIPTTAQKIRRITWTFFSILLPIIGLIRLIGYAVGLLANRITLPAANWMSSKRLSKAKEIFNNFWKGPITSENESARIAFNLEEYTVITPDGTALSLKLLRRKNINEANSTIIYFNGNFELATESLNSWFL